MSSITSIARVSLAVGILLLCSVVVLAAGPESDDASRDESAAEMARLKGDHRQWQCIFDHRRSGWNQKEP